MKKIGLLLCFIFLVGAGFAQDAQSYFDKGMEYFKAENYSQAIPYFNKANELFGGNNSACQFNIGQCYYWTENYTQAVYWYSKAATQGVANAQFSLGVCYDNGQGVTENDAQAVYWYRKAAEQGNGDAQGLLSLCYYLGTGVAEDLEQATYWARKAVAQENTAPRIKELIESFVLK